MTDRFNLRIPDEKHDVFAWLNTHQNKSETIIQALEMMKAACSENTDDGLVPSEEEIAVYQAKLERIFDLTIGHDMGKEGYGNEDTFIRINLEDNTLDRILRWRVANLRRLHPKEADDVLAMWAKRYPRTYAIMRMCP